MIQKCEFMIWISSTIDIYTSRSIVEEAICYPGSVGKPGTAFNAKGYGARLIAAIAVWLGQMFAAFVVRVFE